MSEYTALFQTFEKEMKKCFENTIKSRLVGILEKISTKYNIPMEDLSSEFDVDDSCFDITSPNCRVHPPPPGAGGSGSRICTYASQKGKNKGVKCGSRIKGGGEYCSKHTKKPKSSEKKGVQEDDEAPLEKCQYIFTRGNNKGKACGVNAKGGSSRCGKHIDKENGKIRVTPLRDTPKNTEKKNSAVPDESKNETDQYVKRAPKFTHNKKLDIYVHLPTRLVIRSNLDQTVIGRLVT